MRETSRGVSKKHSTSGERHTPGPCLHKHASCMHPYCTIQCCPIQAPSCRMPRAFRTRITTRGRLVLRLPRSRTASHVMSCVICLPPARNRRDAQPHRGVAYTSLYVREEERPAETRSIAALLRKFGRSRPSGIKPPASDPVYHHYPQLANKLVRQNQRNAARRNSTHFQPTRVSRAYSKTSVLLPTSRNSITARACAPGETLFTVPKPNCGCRTVHPAGNCAASPVAARGALGPGAGRAGRAGRPAPNSTSSPRPSSHSAPRSANVSL